DRPSCDRRRRQDGDDARGRDSNRQCPTSQSLHHGLSSSGKLNYGARVPISSYTVHRHCGDHALGLRLPPHVCGRSRTGMEEETVLMDESPVLHQPISSCNTLFLRWNAITTNTTDTYWITTGVCDDPSPYARD
ncbi:hypothetical protein FRC19_004228, partial [Serendipita sp. 401]